MFNLPLEIVYYILEYLRYKERMRLISKDWLQHQLKRKTHLFKWRSKKRLYSYIRIFGTSFCNYSWSRFCQEILDRKRRSRNIHGKLTWKESANNYFRQRCQGCGKITYAVVFSWSICPICQRNPRLPECYMVSVGEAKSLGIPKRILDTIPWHGSIMGARLRFWKDIQTAIAQ